MISALQEPEPEVLKAIGDESKRAGTDTTTSREIDRIIRAARVEENEQLRGVDGDVGKRGAVEVLRYAQDDTGSNVRCGEKHFTAQRKWRIMAEGE